MKRIIGIEKDQWYYIGLIRVIRLEDGKELKYPIFE
jgi:hypothetical protein